MELSSNNSNRDERDESSNNRRDDSRLFVLTLPSYEDIQNARNRRDTNDSQHVLLPVRLSRASRRVVNTVDVTSSSYLNSNYSDLNSENNENYPPVPPALPYQNSNDSHESSGRTFAIKAAPRDVRKSYIEINQDDDAEKANREKHQITYLNEQQGCYSEDFDFSMNDSILGESSFVSPQVQRAAVGRTVAGSVFSMRRLSIDNDPMMTTEYDEGAYNPDDYITPLANVSVVRTMRNAISTPHLPSFAERSFINIFECDLHQGRRDSPVDENLTRMIIPSPPSELEERSTPLGPPLRRQFHSLPDF